MTAPKNAWKEQVIRYSGFPIARSRVTSIIMGILFVGLVLALMSIGVYFALQAFDTYLRLFPEEIAGAQATNLLNAIIQTDGILIGFFAFVFAASLSGLVSQAGAITSELAKSYHMAGLIGADSIRKRMGTKGTAEYEYHRMLAELEQTRERLLIWMVISTLLLVSSILWSFSRLAIITESVPRSEFQWSLVPLFAAILSFFWAVSRFKILRFPEA